MARWKLATGHYLNTNDTEWEYTENDRSTGRPIRRKFAVPRLLDPRDKADWNYTWGPSDNLEGEIIVCYAGRGEPKDYVFSGDPTPDMIPMDDEAKEISASFEHQWSYKPETDTPGQYSQALVDKFQMDMAEVQTKPVQIEGLDKLVAALAESNLQTQKLLQEAITTRRV